MMVTVELRLLGPPSLVAAGHPVRLHSAKTLALLAYLVLEADTPHSREKLAGLLWGESPEDRARHSLRQALYSLRQALDRVADDCLTLDSGVVIFRHHPNIWVDALEFLTLAPAGSQDLESLHKAADLYRGPLLEGLELSACPAFEEWLFFRHNALEQQALKVLDTLVEGLINRSNYREALNVAQRLVALDPLHEAGHRHLMQIQAALGDPDAVRRQFRLCVEVLARELGTEPSDETQAFYRQLTATKVEAAIPPVRQPALRPTDQPLALPFLGRERELATLQACLDQTIAGQGGLILVEGEAGIGKTRLVTEFIRQSAKVTAGQAQPVRWLSGRCYEPEAGSPYTVWADALQSLSTPEWQPFLAGLPDVWRQQVGRLVPELGPSTGDIEGVTDTESRLRLLQGVVRCLAHLTQSGPVLLFLDDLHWVDGPSLELLHYAARHLVDSPVLIIGTYRPEVLVDSPPLERLLRRTGDVPAMTVIRLTPLDQETVTQLVRHLEAELPSDLPHRLHRHSDGNPFVLVETVRSLMESGRLLREPNALLLEAKAGTLPVPQRVADLIQARVVTLREEQRRVLAAAAVVGRPSGVRLLRHVSGYSEPELLDVVAQLLARAFFRERGAAPPSKSLDFYHDYVRWVIYDGLSSVQRRALHRRAADALLAIHRTRPQDVTEEVARHYEQAADAKALTYLTRAAQQAEELFAYAHATELYSRALAFHRAHLDDEPAGRYDLLLAREATLDRQARRAEQAEDVAALVELAERLGDASRLAVACVRQAGFLTYTGRYEVAHEAGERALALYRATDDQAGEAQALRELGFLHWSNGDYGTALAYSRAALQLHRRLGDVDGEATALHNLAEIQRALGSPRQALQLYEQAQNLYWAQQDRRRQGLTLYGMAHASRQLGNPDGALTRYQQALAHFRASGDRLMVSRAHHALAGLRWEMGDSDQAIKHLSEALTLSRQIGYAPGIAHGLITLSYLYAQRHDLDAARAHLREAMTWLRLMEDETGLAEAEARLRVLERDASEVVGSPTAIGWVKSHVALAEGKVYCEFESPMAQAQS